MFIDPIHRRIQIQMTRVLIVAEDLQALIKVRHWVANKDLELFTAQTVSTAERLISASFPAFEFILYHKGLNVQDIQELTTLGLKHHISVRELNMNQLDDSFT